MFLFLFLIIQCLRSVKGRRFYPVRTCSKNENAQSRCLYVLSNARYAGNGEHAHGVRDEGCWRSNEPYGEGEVGQRVGKRAGDVSDGTIEVPIMHQLESVQESGAERGRGRGVGRGKEVVKCVAVERAINWFDLNMLQRNRLSSNNENENGRRDCGLVDDGAQRSHSKSQSRKVQGECCKVGGDECRIEEEEEGDGIIAVAEDVALHHYLTALAGNRGRVDIYLSRESQLENQKGNCATHGKGSISGRAIRYLAGGEGEEPSSVPVPACVWVGSWSEGHLWVSLLFLLMWDEVSE